MAKIDILLGVHNGACYLDQALDSVLAQDFQDWSLLVRDDGSTDNTLQIIARWREKMSGRLCLLPNPGRRNLGMNGNYSHLLKHSTAPYVTLLSHDDIYHRNKLSLSLAAMAAAEARCGQGHPAMVFTDQRLIDEHGAVIADSYWRHTGWALPRDLMAPNRLGRFIIQNSAAGGTLLINRPLIALLGDDPLAEDDWIGLVAAAFAELVALPATTVDFRRHTANQSELISLASTLRRVIAAPWSASTLLRTRLDLLRPRIRLFLERYRNRLSSQQIETCESFINFPALGPLARRAAILRHGLLYSSRLRNLGLLALV